MASAETLIIPVQDLLLTVPNFTDAPAFGLDSALRGDWIPESRGDRKESATRESRKKIREREKKLIKIMWEEYPDAMSIRIWDGNLIIKREDK